MSERIEIPGLVQGVYSWSPEEGLVCAPARIEAAFPNGFRMAVYPDGSRRLQGAYSWTQGVEGGVIWRDVPEVRVDAEGRPL